MYDESNLFKILATLILGLDDLCSDIQELKSSDIKAIGLDYFAQVVSLLSISQSYKLGV